MECWMKVLCWGREHRWWCDAVEVEVPGGPYRLDTRWLLAADGARSAVRNALGLEFKGEEFEEKFLIADVRTATDYPSDRRFLFYPPFYPRANAVLHRPPADVFWIYIHLRCGRVLFG